MKISGLDRSKIPQLILQFVAKIAREDGPLKKLLVIKRNLEPLNFKNLVKVSFRQKEAI